MNENVRIFIISHNYYVGFKNDIYKVLYVGDKKFDTSDAYRDDIGENIAYKNDSYCELTGQYWAWKNGINKNEIVGFCHYRRFFSLNPFSNSNKWFISEKFIRKIMQNYDVILPRPYFWKITVYEKYFKGGHGKEKDLIVLRNIIQNDYNEYLEDYDFIVNSNCSSYCNSYIMNEQNINLYFTWLFDILKKVENRINITNYNNKEKRVFGYLSEILINVWARHNKLKVKYISLNQINTNFWSKIKNELKIYRKKY